MPMKMTLENFTKLVRNPGAPNRMPPYSAKNLTDEVGASFQSKLFGKDAQAAVGDDEVNFLNAGITPRGQQEVLTLHLDPGEPGENRARLGLVDRGEGD